MQAPLLQRQKVFGREVNFTKVRAYVGMDEEFLCFAQR
jgi:hypothetical protein